jgi:hypothetical protein
MASHDAEHERLQESAGLYVLDALEPAERAAFEAHLRSCEEARGSPLAASGAAALPRRRRSSIRRRHCEPA